MKNTYKFLGLAVIGLLSISATQAATHLVGGTGFADFDAAIAAAADNDTIIGTNGDIFPAFTVTKPLTILGNGAIIDGGNANGTAITLQASSTTIDGFTIQNFKGRGISTKDRTSGLTDLTITNNTINNIDSIVISVETQYPSAAGIFIGHMDGYFYYSGYDLQQDGLQMSQLDYQGLVVDNNTITNIGGGIVMMSVTSSTATDLMITNNNIHTTLDSNGDGIWIDSSSKITVDSNTVQNAAYGTLISSYTSNMPWREWAAVGSSNITITNNTFTNQSSNGRWNGYGVAVFGSDVNSIHINYNDLSNNAKGGVLGAFTGAGTLDATYNYFANGTKALLYAKSLQGGYRIDISAQLIGTIDIDPYYFTRPVARSSSTEAITGDNNVTISGSIIEGLSSSTWSSGSLTLGTGTNVSGLDSTNLTFGGNITSAADGFDVSHNFTGLTAGTYSYEMTYTTSEGTGASNGSFEIPLVAYGCYYDNGPSFVPYIRFNTSASEITMRIPASTQTGVGFLSNTNYVD